MQTALLHCFFSKLPFDSFVEGESQTGLCFLDKAMIVNKKLKKKRSWPIQNCQTYVFSSSLFFLDYLSITTRSDLGYHPFFTTFFVWFYYIINRQCGRQFTSQVTTDPRCPFFYALMRWVVEWLIFDKSASANLLLDPMVFLRIQAIYLAF